MVNISRPGIQEGNYTTWPLKWKKSITDGLTSKEYIDTQIDSKHNILFVLWLDNNGKNRLGTYKLSTGSVIYESPSGSSYVYTPPDSAYKQGINVGSAYLYGYGAARSLQSYLLVLRADNHTIEVWRYPGTGALWSHDIQIDEAGARVYTAEIDVTGKYVLVTTGSTNEKIILYGSG